MKTGLKNLALFFLVFFLVGTTVQLQNGNNKNSSTAKTDFKLVAEKPSIYIDFEKSGKRPPPGDDVSDEAVWLRLHNNMRSTIAFCAFGIFDKKGKLLSYQEAGEIGMHYEVEVTDSRLFDKSKYKVPTGDKVVGVCHVFRLNVGESIVFSIPKEHLAKGLSIKVPFKYEWEDINESNLSHFVYFNSKNIQ